MIGILQFKQYRIQKIPTTGRTAYQLSRGNQAVKISLNLSELILLMLEEHATQGKHND